jgi:hypothetical protein
MGSWHATDLAAVVIQHMGDNKVERLCWTATMVMGMLGLLY